MARITFTLDMDEPPSNDRLADITRVVVDALRAHVRKSDGLGVAVDRGNPAEESPTPSENRPEKPRAACTCPAYMTELDRTKPGGDHKGECPMYDFDPDLIPF